MYSTGMLLWLLVTVCSAVVNEETSRFLNGNGFENLEPRFLDEEIEVRHIPGLPDNLLVDLGVRTIGARLRIRSAATQWLEAQVFVCFVNLLNFVSFLCTAPSIQEGCNNFFSWDYMRKKHLQMEYFLSF